MFARSRTLGVHTRALDAETVRGDAAASHLKGPRLRRLSIVFT